MSTQGNWLPVITVIAGVCLFAYCSNRQDENPPPPPLVCMVDNTKTKEQLIVRDQITKEGEDIKLGKAIDKLPPGTSMTIFPNTKEIPDPKIPNITWMKIAEPKQGWVIKEFTTCR